MQASCCRRYVEAVLLQKKEVRSLCLLLSPITWFLVSTLQLSSGSVIDMCGHKLITVAHQNSWSTGCVTVTVYFWMWFHIKHDCNVSPLHLWNYLRCFWRFKFWKQLSHFQAHVLWCFVWICVEPILSDDSGFESVRDFGKCEVIWSSWVLGCQFNCSTEKHPSFARKEFFFFLHQIADEDTGFPSVTHRIQRSHVAQGPLLLSVRWAYLSIYPSAGLWIWIHLPVMRSLRLSCGL